jgi:hypothetical protein
MDLEWSFTMTLALDMAEVEARVAKGLEWLKTVGAEHDLDHTRINLFGLDMVSSSECTFSRSCPSGTSYYGKRRDLATRGVIPDTSRRDWDHEHGFWAMSDRELDRAEEYGMLALAWIRALRADPEWREHHGLPLLTGVPSGVNIVVTPV